MTAIKLGILDKAVFGQPWHGIWKSGSITLPNAASHPCPAVAAIPTLPAGSGVPKSGSAVLIRVPGVVPIVRSQDEQTADTAAGREWRNYAIISGGVYGASAPITKDDGNAYVIYIDGANKKWLLRFTPAGSELSLSAKRFGYISTGAPPAWSAATTISCPGELIPGLTANEFPLSSTTKFATVAQNTSGSDFVLGAVATNISSSESYGRAKMMCRFIISGVLNTSLAGYGLSVAPEMIEWPNRMNLKQQLYTEGQGRIEFQQTQYSTRNGATEGDVNIIVSSHNGTTFNGIPRDNWSAQNPGVTVQPWAYDPGQLDVVAGGFVGVPAHIGAQPSMLRNDFKGSYVHCNTAEKYFWATYVEDVFTPFKAVFRQDLNTLNDVTGFSQHSIGSFPQLEATWYAADPDNPSRLMGMGLFQYCDIFGMNGGPACPGYTTRHEKKIEHAFQIFAGDLMLFEDKKSVGNADEDIVYPPKGVVGPTGIPEGRLYQQDEVISWTGYWNMITNFSYMLQELYPAHNVSFGVPAIPPGQTMVCGAQVIVKVARSDQSSDTFTDAFSPEGTSLSLGNLSSFPYISMQPVTREIRFDSDPICWF